MSAAVENHYTVSKLALKWGLASNTIKRMFQDEPGVLRVSMPRLLHRTHKPHVTLRIPESVAARVHARWSKVEAQQVVRRGKLMAA